jgi:hypothetical protein
MSLNFAPRIILAILAAGGLATRALSSPNDRSVLPTPNAKINPATGLPAKVDSPGIDPATGLPTLLGPGTTNSVAGLPDDDNALPAELRLAMPAEHYRRLEAYHESEAAFKRAQDLSEKGQHDQALQAYLKIYAQARESRDGVRLDTVLPSWIELGKKYPKARQALVEIRDRDTRELAEENGTVQLFEEVIAINSALQDEGSTLVLFKSLEQNAPRLAQQSYSRIQTLLVQRGEYQTCLKHLRNPQATFGFCCDDFERHQRLLKGVAQQRAAAAKQFGDILRQQGARTPPPTADLLQGPLKGANDRLVREACEIIEILVATGQKEQAEQIRVQALEHLDDPRLKSAVSDAEKKTRK